MLNTMLEDLFEETWKELDNATQDREHPFRFCCLATADSKKNIRQRTVILREITKRRDFFFYTDNRSAKIDQIHINPQGSLLFYNATLGYQLIVKGEIEIMTNTREWQEHKDRLEGKALYDYNTELPPGKPVKNPYTVDRTEDVHFALLAFTPTSIEYLKLKTESNHLRAIFTKNGDEWNKTFVVP